ncbi:DNA helicase IV [Vibrio ishigakensis]|uniref:DNA helicase IV n=1 Tax=Vibrio ishigakensis TaxID=1481914 RepID=A0A0B8P1B7_9VIBR|nr:DNA helicase IV [Vibrio ishigakensis]
MSVVSISVNLWGKLTNSFDTVTFEDGTINLYRKGRRIDTIDTDNFQSFTVSSTSWLGGSITLPKSTCLNGLNPKQVSSFTEAINTAIEKRVASRTLSDIKDFELNAVNSFPRDSESKHLAQICESIHLLTTQRPSLLSSFGDSDRNLVRLIADFYPLDIASLRAFHEGNQLQQREEFYDAVESNPLTQEQRLAVIRNNDRNMVLAAAGTGKTSVMVAKILDLVDRKIASPSQILTMAYNKSAATELDERLSEKAQKSNVHLEERPQISTFHALGRKILQESGIDTRLSQLTQDSDKLDIWVSRWLQTYLLKHFDKLPTLIEMIAPPIDPMSYRSAAAFQRYQRDNTFSTIKGEKVKGFQELLIANYLFIKGVEYEYEPQYPVKQRVSAGVDYRPDFYLPQADVYLEHFGISRDGSTRIDIDSVKYNSDIEWKRQFHESNGTKLVETYHYNWVEGTLNNRLDSLISELEIPAHPKNKDEILKHINESDYISDGAKILRKCLSAIRSEGLSPATIFQRLTHNDIIDAKSTTDLLTQLHDDYIEELRSNESIDFDDMINLATEVVASDEFTPSWSQILIDEFQDISASRMKLITTIIEMSKTKPALTVVGDDWQSIYRFSGGKLELTTRFADLIGSYSETKLQKTFRYNNSIAKTAGLFVMENPEQYQKQIQTHTVVDTPQVYLLDDKKNGKDALETKIYEVVSKIRSHDSQGSIAIIGRYNYLLSEANIALGKRNARDGVKFWTFHKSKGLEADYCILIGFSQGKQGFPSDTLENTVVEALLPSIDSFPDSEERRLFYVGVTRAKKKAYIIADPSSPSKFVTELLNPKFGVGIHSESFKQAYRTTFKCKHCEEGFLKRIEGQYGDFYTCSTGNGCAVKNVRSCSKCGSPSSDTRSYSVCHNPACGHKSKVCPACGRPMVKRTGKKGIFWGCSGYSLSHDQCTYTEKLSASDTETGSSRKKRA